MSRQPGLSEWTDLVSTHMPHLSVPQARVLALWSYGIALTRSCGRLTVATFLALLMRQKVATVEQRLYEWCCPAAHKAGGKRQTVDVTTCFMPLLRWVVALWASTQMALALDATSLGARFVVLTVSVVYRGCAIRPPRGRGARHTAADVIQCGRPATRVARRWRREGFNKTLHRLQRSNLLLQGGDLHRVLCFYGLNAFRGMALQIRPECILEDEARLVVFQR